MNRTEQFEDPARSAELADSLSTTALSLLERLDPLDRAVFVLREVFGLGFPEVASVVGHPEEVCRRLASRARRYVDAGRPRFEADRREREELAARFFDAVREGDADALLALLAADVRIVGDGGGKVPQFAHGVSGAERAARHLAVIVPVLIGLGVTFERQELGGRPGAVVRDRSGRVLHTWVLDVLDGRIQTVRAVSDPAGLGHTYRRPPGSQEYTSTEA
jgi:RNA polymerase sigma-70 factor (ECF subfamily)